MIINLKSQTDLSGFYIVYEGSTNIERKGIYGISHLGEHLMCKAYEHLQNEFERYGIMWNAYTSSNEIVFYFTGLDEYVSKYRDVVINLLNNFMPSEEQFTNEKRIVIEEYKDCFNDQVSSHYLNLSRKLFGDFDPIGSLQDLESMTYQNMVDFVKLQYNRPTKIINISKHSDFTSNVEFNVVKLERNLEYGNHDVILELNNEFKDKSSVIMLSPVITKDFNYLIFICEMLSSGLQSPLYQEVREKRGLTYNISSSVNKICDKGMINICVQTSNSKVSELIDTVKLVLDNPNTYLTQERFDNVRDGMIVRKKKAEINRYNNISRWLSTPEWDVYEILDTLTLDKIKEVYSNYFKTEGMYISVDKSEFENTEADTPQLEFEF